jgi:hypothetical protein
MGKSAPSAPPPPDYVGAAKETASGNLEAARANIAANRVNQITQLLRRLLLTNNAY